MLYRHNLQLERCPLIENRIRCDSRAVDCGRKTVIRLRSDYVRDLYLKWWQFLTHSCFSGFDGSVTRIIMKALWRPQRDSNSFRQSRGGSTLTIRLPSRPSSFFLSKPKAVSNGTKDSKNFRAWLWSWDFFVAFTLFLKFSKDSQNTKNWDGKFLNFNFLCQIPDFLAHLGSKNVCFRV